MQAGLNEEKTLVVISLLKRIVAILKVWENLFSWCESPVRMPCGVAHGTWDRICIVIACMRVIMLHRYRDIAHVL